MTNVELMSRWWHTSCMVLMKWYVTKYKCVMCNIHTHNVSFLLNSSQSKPVQIYPTFFYHYKNKRFQALNIYIYTILLTVKISVLIHLSFGKNKRKQHYNSTSNKKSLPPRGSQFIFNCLTNYKSRDATETGRKYRRFNRNFFGKI